MRATRLLRECVRLPIESVIDVGVGPGYHSMAFLSSGKKVTGIDYSNNKLSHDSYTHIQAPYETLDIEADLVWCSHTLEHVADPGFMLRKFRNWTNGYLAIAVPTHKQEEIHIGHLTVWTPFHLMYNLVVNGWDCKEARWYTEGEDIGLLVQKTDDIDMSGRTAMLSERHWLNSHMPIEVDHRGNAWWGDNWYAN